MFMMAAKEEVMTFFSRQKFHVRGSVIVMGPSFECLYSAL